MSRSKNRPANTETTIYDLAAWADEQSLHYETVRSRLRAAGVERDELESYRRADLERVFAQRDTERAVRVQMNAEKLRAAKLANDKTEGKLLDKAAAQQEIRGLGIRLKSTILGTAPSLVEAILAAANKGAAEKQATDILTASLLEFIDYERAIC